MKTSILVAVIVSFVLLLSACGQTGPLYLPKKGQQHETSKHNG